MPSFDPIIMADKRCVKSREATALLQRAASLLTEEPTQPQLVSGNTTTTDVQTNETMPSHASTSVNPTNNSASNASNPVPLTAQTSTSVHDEFRRLFAPYSNANNGSLVWGPPPKRSKTNSWGPTRYFKLKDLWTHKFMCLANPQQNCTPSRLEKSKSQKAGLGRKRIIFNRKDNPVQVKLKLEESYPKLVEGGGFEILRSGASQNTLEVIEPPPSGYSISFLRDHSGLGQAIAYIRPLQLDLDILPLPEPSGGEIHNNGGSDKTGVSD